MTPDTKSPSLIALLSLVKTFKRDDERLGFSPAEKAARVSALLDRLVNYPQPSFVAQVAPMTLSAEER
jgi:vancomycin permeability regulator SanA